MIFLDQKMLMTQKEFIKKLSKNGKKKNFQIFKIS